MMNFNNPSADFGAFQPPQQQQQQQADPFNPGTFAAASQHGKNYDANFTSEDEDDNPFSLPDRLRPSSSNNPSTQSVVKARRISNESEGTDTSGPRSASSSSQAHTNNNYIHTSTAAPPPPVVVLRPVVGNSSSATSNMNPHTPFHDNASALSGATGMGGGGGGPVDFMPMSEFDQQPNNFNGAAGSRAPTTHYVKGRGWFLSRNVLLIAGVIIIALLIVIIGLAVGLGKRGAGQAPVVILNNATKNSSSSNPIETAAEHALLFPNDFKRDEEASTTTTDLPSTTTTTEAGSRREARIVFANDDAATEPSSSSSQQPESSTYYPTPPPSVDQRLDRFLAVPVWKFVPRTTTESPNATTTTSTTRPVYYDDANVPDNISIRLPLTFRPKHYNVELRPVLEPEFRFSGMVEIDMVSSPNRTLMSDRIVLHSKELLIDTQNVSVLSIVSEEYDVAPWQLQVLNVTEDITRDFLIIQLGETVAPSTAYRVKLNFSGVLDRDLVGIYLSSYNTTETDGTNKTHWLMASHMQPTDARRVFPMFDEPAFKATFNITMIHAKNLTALSNMPLLQPTQPHPTDSDLVVDRFIPSPPMSTYLLAFVLTDFPHIEQNTSTGTLIRMWARPEIIQNAKFALTVSSRLVDYYENYFQLNYPLKILDQVAIPNMYTAGMENWGLILYAEDSLIYDENVNPADQRKVIIGNVAHQIAHQWFGNLVSPAWWDDLWLNEGFATYVQYVGGNRIRPEWHYMNDFLVEEMQNSMAKDALRTTHPIRAPVYKPDEISQQFDEVMYGKGAALLRMMRYFLGETIFSRGINKYLRQFEYSTATQDDLWNQLSITAREGGLAKVDVKPIMDSWTLQSGIPVVHILRRNNSNGEPIIHLSQERFLLLDNSTISNFSNAVQTWQIPLTIMTQTYEKPLEDVSSVYNYSLYALDGQTQTIWLTEQTMMLNKANAPNSMPTSSRHWILANILQSGYFRVNYDNRNWRLLLAQLIRSPTVIHVANRAQLIDDAFNLARAGYLPSYDIPLGMMRSYLPDETDYLPWQATINALEHIDYMLRSTPDYDVLRDLMLRTLGPISLKLDLWNITQSVASALTADNDTAPIIPDLATIKLRTLIYQAACYFDMPECVLHAKQLFNTWMVQYEGSKQAHANLTAANPMPVDFKPTMYTTAVRLGGVAEWDFAWVQYTTTQDPVEQKVLLDAMGATREPWLLRRYMRMAIDELQIKRSHVMSVFSAVGSSSETGQKIAWEMLVDEWPVIFTRFGGQSPTLADAVDNILISGNKQELYDSVVKFVVDHKAKLGTSEQAFLQNLEQMQANIGWMRDNKDKMVVWLQIASAISRIIEAPFMPASS